MKLPRSSNWKSFESVCLMAIQQHVTLLRIPRKGAQVIGQTNDGRPDVKLTKVAVDFCGTIKGTGRAFLTDAKSTEHPTHFKFSMLSDEQHRELVDHGKVGAVAGVIIESIAMGKTYWLPWTVLNTNERSIAWTDSRLVWLGLRSVAPDLMRVIPNDACVQTGGLFR